MQLFTLLQSFFDLPVSIYYALKDVMIKAFGLDGERLNFISSKATDCIQNILSTSESILSFI